MRKRILLGVFAPALILAVAGTAHGHPDPEQSRVRVIHPKTLRVFHPILLTTPTLTITGQGFTPVQVHTRGLSITGSAFTPLRLKTDRLGITGSAFVPIRLTTTKLTITGGKKWIPAKQLRRLQ